MCTTLHLVCMLPVNIVYTWLGNVTVLMEFCWCQQTQASYINPQATILVWLGLH